MSLTANSTCVGILLRVGISVCNITILITSNPHPILTKFSTVEIYFVPLEKRAVEEVYFVLLRISK